MAEQQAKTYQARLHQQAEQLYSAACEADSDATAVEIIVDALDKWGKKSYKAGCQRVRAEQGEAA